MIEVELTNGKTYTLRERYIGDSRFPQDSVSLGMALLSNVKLPIIYDIDNRVIIPSHIVAVRDF